MAASVKALRQNTGFIHGSAVPKQHSNQKKSKELQNSPISGKNLAPKSSIQTATVTTASRAATAAAPSVSLFAIIGFFVVATLMIFVMLAQVNYNEVLRETERLNTHLSNLKEQQRVLSIRFESVVDMDEVENYAKDVLGMSKPESETQVVMRALPPDRVEVISYESDTKWWVEIGGYLSFLFDSYIK